MSSNCYIGINDYIMCALRYVHMMDTVSLPHVTQIHSANSGVFYTVAVIHSRINQY